MASYFSDDPTGWARTLKAYLILVGHATRRETTTYGVLGEQIDEIPLNVSNHLRPLFNYCENNSLPRLVVLVVSGTSGEPGDGYPGPRESINVDREAAYNYDWLELVPPSVDELTNSWNL